MDLPNTISGNSNTDAKSVLPPLPDTFKETAKSSTTQFAATPKKKTPIATIMLFVLVALIGISLPLFFIWNNNAKIEQQSQKQAITVVTSNEEIQKALVKEFVYTTTGKSDYYSPALDATLAFDRSKLSVSENSKSVSLYANSYHDLYTELFFISTEKTPFDYFKQEYGTFTKFNQTAAEEKDGYSFFTFSFESTPFDKKTKASTLYYSVYYVKNDQEAKYAVLKVSSRAENTIPAAAEALFTEALLSVNMKPENVAADITAEVPDLDAQVKFDKKLWSVLSQSDNYLSLSLVNKSNSGPDIYTSFSSIYYRKEQTTAILEEALKDEVETTKKYHEELKVTTEKKEVKVGTRDALMTAYVYPSGSGSVVKNYYVGWLPNETGYFTVTVTKFLDKTDAATVNDADIEKLLQNVTFTSVQAGLATGISPNVLGDTSVQVDAPAIIGKLGTVHIATTMCAQLSINDPAIIPNASAMKFKELCGSGTGSGFFVTEDGHIVTNSHVVANSPFYIMEELFINDDSPVFMLVANEIAARIQANDPTYFDTKEAVAQFKAEVKVYILDLIGQKKISFTNVKTASYMETETPFSFDSNTGKLTNLSAYAELELLKSNTLTSPIEHYAKLITEKKSISSNPFTYDVPDVAVLKVKTPTTKYPTLTIANHNLVTEGSKLFVIGFPGVAESKELYAKSSTMSATITTGTVSAIKPSVNNAFKLIQTDAGINPGNSGGPIIDGDAKAIAISTYSQSSVTAGNYNSGVSIEEAAKMLADAGVTPAEGTLSKNLKSGIDNLKRGYYQWAVRDLNLVITDYPVANTLLQPFKLLAQEKIANGEDNTPLAEIAGYYIHKTELPYIFVGMGVAVIAIIAMIVSIFKKAGKAKRAVPTAPPTLPVQPTAGFGQTPPMATPQAPSTAVPSIVPPITAPVEQPKASWSTFGAPTNNTLPQINSVGQNISQNQQSVVPAPVAVPPVVAPAPVLPIVTPIAPVPAPVQATANFTQPTPVVTTPAVMAPQPTVVVPPVAVVTPEPVKVEVTAPVQQPPVVSEPVVVSFAPADTQPQVSSMPIAPTIAAAPIVKPEATMPAMPQVTSAAPVMPSAPAVQPVVEPMSQNNVQNLSQNPTAPTQFTPPM